MFNRTVKIIFVFILITAITLIAYHRYQSGDQSKNFDDWKSRDALISGIETELHMITGQMQAVQGESICKTDDQCKVVGIGSKVCGEYKDFIIYSTKDADEQKLLKLILEFNQVHEKLTSMSLSANQCGTKPAIAHCLNQHCIIK